MVKLRRFWGIKLSLIARVRRYLRTGANVFCTLEWKPMNKIRSLSSYVFKGKSANCINLRNGLCIYNGKNISFLEFLGLFNDIYLQQVYTPKGYEIEANNVVIDIGANIGMFSLFAAIQDPSVKVYSFEPFLDSFLILQKNKTLNEMRNISCYDFAVSGSSGRRELHLRDSSDTGHVLLGQSITEEKLIDLDIHSCIEVKCKTLKEIFDENTIEECNLLKLDCEGSEFDILFNTPKSYLERIRKISMEFHNGVTNYTHKDLQRFLEEHGFIVEKVIEGRNSPTGFIYAAKRR